MGTMNEDVRTRVANTLAALPDDPDGIAGVLEAAGITGDSTGNSCPMYHYLHGQFPEVEWVSGSRGDIVARRAVALPFDVEQFVARFDAGKYPDLRGGAR